MPDREDGVFIYPRVKRSDILIVNALTRESDVMMETHRVGSSSKKGVSRLERGDALLSTHKVLEGEVVFHASVPITLPLCHHSVSPVVHVTDTISLGRMLTELSVGPT